MESTLEKINKASLKFLAPLTPTETFATIVEEAIKLVDGDDGFIVLEQDGKFQTVYSSSKLEFNLKTSKKGFIYISFSEKKAFVILNKDTETGHPEYEKTGIKSSLFVPLLYKNRSIGVLVIRSFRDKRFSQEELNMLKLFGSLASMAIKKTQLYDETRKALETRDLFISMAGHELRTPLTTINGYIQLLQRKVRDSNTQESRWINQVAWETLRLTHLINELLEVNKIKTGIFNYVLKECKLREILESAINSVKFKYPNHTVILQDNLKLKSDIVIGDFDKLLSVLNNLLDNAAKFSQKKTTIKVILTIKSNCLAIIIQDKGKGIDKNEIPKILEGFYKTDKSIETGLGIGLFLAKNIIKNHHGTLTISSELNKGTIAEIKLPKAKV